MRIPSLLPPLLLALLMCIPRHAGAQALRTWVGGNSTWNSGANWSGGAVPSSTGSAEIDSGTVSLPATVSGTAIFIYLGRTPFSNAGLTISGGLLSSTNSSVGDAANSNNTVSITGGTWSNAVNYTLGNSGTGVLNVSGTGVFHSGTADFFGNSVDAMILGNAAGSSGVVTVSNTGSFIASGTLEIGASGTGSLTINDQSTATSNTTLLGVNAGSGGSVLVNGGTWNTGNLKVGNNTTGIVVMNGGTAIGSGAYFGFNAGSYGSLTMNGGLWSAGGGVPFIGYSGTGVLNVQGGTFTNTYLDVGHVSTGLGTVSVSSGSLYSSFEMSIGWGGAGNMLLTGGVITSHTNTIQDGSFSSGTYYSNVGFRAGSSGTATVQSGSWINGSNLDIGSSGTGRLSMSGGYISSGSSVRIGYTEGASGNVSLTGGTMAVAGQMIVGNGLPGSFTTSSTYIFNNLPSSGVLTINGAMLTTGSGGIIGSNPGSSGTATLTSGSWISSGTLIVGAAGRGMLNINGGLLTGTSGRIPVLDIASGSGSLGSVSVSNNGSLSAGTLIVGDGGIGTLNVNSTTISGAAIIGSAASSSGTMSITGGTWNAGAITVGSTGAGVLNISGSAYVSSTNSSASIGSAAGSSGTVNVTTGGTWNILAGNSSIFFGQSGTGLLNVNGGMVSGSAMNPQIENGTVKVTSGTFAISSPRSFIVGNSGTANLLVNGGYASDRNVIIGSNATATVSSGTWVNTGSFVMSSTSGALNISGGEVDAVSSGTGAMTIGGGTVNISGGKLVVGPGGTGSLQMTSGAVNLTGGELDAAGGALQITSGTLNIGSGSSAGVLNIPVINGFNPAAVVNFNTAGTNIFSQQLDGALTVNQNGPGATVLTGSNIYIGPTSVNSGTLVVNGSIVYSGVTVNGGGVLAGSGLVGTISGAGRVAPGGNSILTTAQVDPTAGMSYAFHMSGAGQPNYGNAAASGNDVLHLTDPTAPLISALTSANTIAVDFTGLVLQSGQIYYGGLFTDAAIANSMVQNATFVYTGLNGATVQFAGMTTVASAAFASGTVNNGEVMEFDVTGSPVPAAPPWALLLAGAGLLIAAGRRGTAR